MQAAKACFCALQMVVYMQQQQQDGRDGANAQDGLSAFIHGTVTIHSLITDRIDKLQPGEQLTLKVPQSCVALSNVHTPVVAADTRKDVRRPRYKGIRARHCCM